MKTALMILATLLCPETHAQDHVGGKAYPICNEEMTNMPCLYPENETSGEIADMFIDNIKGLNKIVKQAPGIKKKLTGGFMLENARIIQLKRETKNGKPYSFPATTYTQYEIILNDCRGTDACNGAYLWTVTAKTDSDGYCYETKYENKLEKIDYYAFPKPIDADQKPREVILQ